MSPALPSYEEAAVLVAHHAAGLGQRRPALEVVDLGLAAGRVLAQPLFADSDQPPFARATRDGFACRAAEASARELLAVAGASRAGEPPAGPLPPGAAWEIMTGAPVPAGADAVMMLEHVKTVHVELAHAETAGGCVRLLPSRKVKPGENIVAQGAQARQGDELLPVGTTIHSAQIALAASCGYSAIEVYIRPRVAILATGDELVPVETSPAPGQIRNSNAPMLAAMVAAAGGEPCVLPTAADNAESLDRALVQAAEADLLLISGGVSAGKFDLVEPALARAGARFHFTGVRIQPGKPLVFGELPVRSARSAENENSARRDGNGAQCFFGLPGNPVSSAVTFLLFAAPVLAALAGSLQSGPRFALATLSSDAGKLAKKDLTRFLPAYCNFSGSTSQLPEVQLVPTQGSGDLAALARSNCFLVVPEQAQPFRAGAIVRILLCQ
jgi:molybdopterin molybdotransferase